MMTSWDEIIGKIKHAYDVIELFIKKIWSGQSSMSILLDAACKSYRRGDYKNADIFFGRVLDIEPNHIEALNSKGVSLYRLGEYDKAKRCFNKVLQLDPKNILSMNFIDLLYRAPNAKILSGDMDVPVSYSYMIDKRILERYPYATFPKKISLGETGLLRV